MSSNSVIAKNTIYLYIRAIVSMVIGLYTSRVVIDVLGVEDYGVYGVAGGVVGMLGFLNASMAGATSRFITVALGKDSQDQTKIVFANALTIHVIIALAVLILSEALGIWFLNCKLKIPAQSLYAANWVFQLSILTTLISITQVPYQALIMSHERMNIYAYFELASVILKLLIVFLLLVCPGDKLIVYALCTTLITIGIALLYRFYCIKHFSESDTFIKFNKEVMKPMLSFSMWDLYGNACVTVRNQGTTFILNIFFGVAVNGAASIASVLNGVLIGLSYNIITAFRPQIIKAYAQSSWERFQELVDMGSVYSGLMLSVMAIPLIFETEYIFGLWLGDVPDYVVVFSRIGLISAIIAQIASVITIGIHASGNIKAISFITGTIYIISLPAMYIILKYSPEPQLAYIIALFTNIMALGSNMFILKNNVKAFSIKMYLMKIVKFLSILIIPSIISYYIHASLNDTLLRVILIVLESVGISGLLAYFLLLNCAQRMSLCSKIKARYVRI